MAGKSQRLPLEGIRVVDLTRVWAGPYATRILGDLGAEVIKIEAPFLPDGRTGGYALDNEPGDDPWESSGIYQKNNRSKRSLTLDLRQPEGQDVFKKLVAISDVVIENYSPRVMPQLGLDYAHLREVNPALIFVSLPGFGASGPQKDWLAYGTTLDSHSGLVSLTGYQDGPPHRMAIAIGDPVGGMYGVLAVMGALFRRRAGDGGSHLDLAQSEALIQFVGPFFIDWSMNGRMPDRAGNRDPDYAPQDCFPCAGDDEWVAISVTSDVEWRSLCGLIGESALALEYPTARDRRASHEDVVRHISRWTSVRPKMDVAAALQAVGVPAGPVNTSRDVVFDPHLAVRGAFELVSHPDGSTRPQIGPMAHLSETPGRVTRPAPRFGADNAYVLGKLLGLDAERVAELEALKVISDQPLIPLPDRQPIKLERWLQVGTAVRVDPEYRELLREQHGATIPEPTTSSARTAL